MLEPISEDVGRIAQPDSSPLVSHATTASVRPVDTPQRRIGACVVCRDDAGRVLLVRASVGTERTWFLPGGGLDFGEHPQLGALRELHEETGYVADLESLLAVEVLRVADPAGAAWELLYIVYQARIVGGKLTGWLR